MFCFTICLRLLLENILEIMTWEHGTLYNLNLSSQDHDFSDLAPR